jgi:hypothetical protein
MSHCVLFHLEWHVTAYGGWIVVGGHLIFFLLFSLVTSNVYHCPICFLLFNFSSHTINFLFRLFFIYRSFYSFQFSPSIAISHMFGFSFWSSFFLIFNFILGTFVKVFFFQFYHSIRFSVVLFVLVWPLFFWFFFLLLKLFFNSIKPSNCKSLSF